MGLAFRKPAFTEEQLQLYQDCTYFSRKDILRLYRRFCSLGGGEVDRRAGDVSTRLSFVFIQDMPEMRQNPFKVSSPFYLLFFLSIHFCKLFTKTELPHRSDCARSSLRAEKV